MEENLKVPLHVSIIMDGNGRWAAERSLARTAGHAEGVESVRACTEAAVENGVKYLSLYAFSEENWNRPESEVSALMNLMAKAMVDELKTLLGNDVRFIVLGHRSRLEPELNAAIDDCMEKTKNNKTLTLIVFLSYSGRWDILQAAKHFAMDILEHPEKKDCLLDCGTEIFDSYLVTAGIPDPDLVIRTSGEQRISNYLLWQSAYSEFYYTDVLWPDFRKEDFKKALMAFSKRDRRYGKVK